jgi:hypothetical protein
LLTIVALLIAKPGLAADLLLNGGFDDMPLGTGWTQVLADPSYPLVVTGSELPSGVSPQSGGAVVWLGGILSSTDAIYQAIDVPEGTTNPTLSGYLWIATSETGTAPFDHLYAEVLAPDNSVLEVLRHWTNSNHSASWVPFSLQATRAYAGMPIRLRFRSINDESFTTNFWIDTCALDAPTAVGVGTSLLPTVSQLLPPSPNPSRGTSQWRLDLAASGYVHAGVYDLHGRLVHRIVDKPFTTGSHNLFWDGSDARGGKAPSGVYFCLVKAGGQAFSQRITLIR